MRCRKRVITRRAHVLQPFQALERAPACRIERRVGCKSEIRVCPQVLLVAVTATGPWPELQCHNLAVVNSHRTVPCRSRSILSQGPLAKVHLAIIEKITLRISPWRLGERLRLDQRCARAPSCRRTDPTEACVTAAHRHDVDCAHGQRAAGARRQGCWFAAAGPAEGAARAGVPFFGVGVARGCRRRRSAIP